MTEYKYKDFEMGISDEVINIIALEQGIQIVTCKSSRKSNNYIFLLPKRSPDSEFKPSEQGRKLIHNNSVETDSTQYVAVIVEFLEIPGTDPKYWEELYAIGEFKLWDIYEGPLKYFKESNKSKMFLWILRVYKMPFKILERKDYERKVRNNSRINNPDTLEKIQSGFSNKGFSPVISDEEFEIKYKKILETTKKFW